MQSGRWLSLVILALVGVFLFACSDKQEQPAANGAQSTAVHPCDETKDEVFGLQPSALRDTTPVSATRAPSSPSPTGSPAARDSSAAVGVPGCEGPDFSQRCALWASDEYDHASTQDVGCGRTMAQCGCALTSAASLLLHYGVTRGPDGAPTTPKSLNAWFKSEGRPTASGTVSRGYVYGSVNWLAVAAYSKQAAARFGTPELTFAGVLGSDVSALRREVENARPVILEQPGHFILATSARSDVISIADPFYADRTRLDVPSYGNKFRSGRLYRPGPDFSAVMIAAPRNVKFSVTDRSGASTGIHPTSGKPVTDIRQSSFSSEQAWRDPTCTRSAPLPGSGVDLAILTQPPQDKYSLEVKGDAAGRYSVAVYAYDQAAGMTLETFDGQVPSGRSVKISIDYNPAAGSRQRIEVEPGTQLAATPTPRPAGAASTATSAPVATAPLASTPAPSPTRSPQAATRTPTRTPTPTPTPPGNRVETLTLSVAPASAFCNDSDNYAVLTAVARDGKGSPVPNVVIQFQAASGTVTPGSATTTANGSASTKFYPPTGSVGQIQLSARLTTSAAGPSANATFTCRIVLPPITVPIGPIGPIAPPPTPTPPPIL